jgi:hypothetical protein
VHKPDPQPTFNPLQPPSPHLQPTFSPPSTHLQPTFNPPSTQQSYFLSTTMMKSAIVVVYKYQCKLCGAKKKTRSALRTHLRSVHKKKTTIVVESPVWQPTPIEEMFDQSSVWEPKSPEISLFSTPPNIQQQSNQDLTNKKVDCHQ